MAAIRSLGGPDEPDVYAEVARLFLVDVPIHLSALAAAIAAADSESVWQIAHRLRGSTLEMGVLRMAPLCAEIEHAARGGSLRARGGAGRTPRSRVRDRAGGDGAGDQLAFATAHAPALDTMPSGS